MTAPEPTPTAEHIDAVAQLVNPSAFSEYAMPTKTYEPYRREAQRVAADLLTSTDPAVHAAMLDALVRAGVLTEQRQWAADPTGGTERTCLATPWVVAP